MNVLFHYIKIILVVFCLMVFPVIVSGQVTVQIGTGNDAPSNGTQYSPLYRFSAGSAATNSRSDILFTQAELAAAGIPAGSTILSVQFNKLNANNFLIPTNFTMLMKNSSNAVLDPAVMTWADVLNSFTAVYSNVSFNLPASAGWVVWNLQTPFLYNGGSLEIATENTMTGGTAGATGNIAWEWTAGTPQSSIIGSTNLGSFSSGQAPYRARPNLRITYYPPQTTVQIGTGSDAPTNGTQYSPMYRFSAASTTTNSRSDILFTQSELTAAGIPAGATITNIQFNKLNNNYFLIPTNFNMLMSNSPNTSLDPSTITWSAISNTFTSVYSNPAFNVPATSGWVDWNLQVPFVYSGAGLEIATDNTMTGGATGATGNIAWQWTASTPVTMAVGATNLAAFATGQSVYRARPNTKITYYAPACVVPSVPVVTNITNTTATINWGAVNGAVGYQYAITTNATPPSSGIDNTTTSINATGLNPLTQYYVHVRTNCGSGYSLFWATTPFSTLEPCPKPSQSVVAASNTNGAAMISWNPSPFGASGYEYALTTSATPPASGTLLNATSYQASGLLGNTRYFFHVRANCAAQGNSSWMTKEFLTPCYTPALSVTATVKSGDADFEWSSTAGSKSYEYAVTETVAKPVSGYTTTQTSYHASGLHSGATYYFHVRSSCGSSVSDWATLPFNTLGLEVYPNPVKETMLIKLHSGTAINGQLKIGDATGRIIEQVQLINNSLAVNTRKWAPGIYLIRYDDGKNKYSVRIVKQ